MFSDLWRGRHVAGRQVPALRSGVYARRAGDGESARQGAAPGNGPAMARALRARCPLRERMSGHGTSRYLAAPGRSHVPVCLTKIRVLTQWRAPTAPLDLPGMDQYTNDQHPPRHCDLCARPMQFLSTLPALGSYRCQRVYKCTECRYATADTVEPARGQKGW